MGAVIDDKGLSICGATLLNNRHLLTAAHCVEGKAGADVRVILGVHDLEKARDGDKYGVDSFVVHSDYRVNKNKGLDMDMFENDLALIRLKEPLKLNSDISPICLSKPGADDPLKGGLTVLGWGQLSPNSRSRAQKLQMLTLPELPSEECGKTWDIEVGTNRLCMGQPMKNICKGDDGGPLMVEKGGNRWYQVGIVSFSGPVCGDRYPGVYARIGSYLDWISNNTQSGEFCAEPKS
jgi:secreted trypsin-like serine protease